MKSVLPSKFVELILIVNTTFHDLFFLVQVPVGGGSIRMTLPLDMPLRSSVLFRTFSLFITVLYSYISIEFLFIAVKVNNIPFINILPWG